MTDIELPSNAVEIETKRFPLNPNEFDAVHCAGSGLPCIIDGLQEDWRARTAWDFDFLKERIGRTLVCVLAPLFNPKIMAVTRLASYLDYCTDPSRLPKIERVMFGDLDKLSECGAALYCGRFNHLLSHPELEKDYIKTPRFSNDWALHLTDSTRRLMNATQPWYSWLFVGPSNTRAELHQDFLRTHAYLAQLRGRKLCILFSPDDTQYLLPVDHDPERSNPVTDLDPLEPDTERFPNVDKATPYVAMLNPGQTAFIPSGWYHFAISQDPSITISYNWFNQHNFGRYMEDMIGSCISHVFGNMLVYPAAHRVIEREVRIKALYDQAKTFTAAYEKVHRPVAGAVSPRPLAAT